VTATLELRSGAEPFPGYRLKRLRGRGGFAEVWEAETASGSLVALKFMPTRDGHSAALEVRSIQAMKQLRHPHLIRIERVWTQKGYIVIAMELADGSLLDLLECYLQEYGTPIAPDLVCTYLRQAALALDFLNTRRHTFEGKTVGFQHCDVKPANMLVIGDTVKLADYGLATATTSTSTFHRRAGTLDFAPPEIFQGMLSDRSDQYALAVTYYILRTGNLPFPKKPMSFTKSYIRPAPDLRLLPEAERTVLTRALAPVPQDRWPSSMEMIDQLGRLFAPQPEDAGSGARGSGAFRLSKPGF
jgi:serine/threonine protein kinase, bacterial